MADGSLRSVVRSLRLRNICEEEKEGGGGEEEKVSPARTSSRLSSSCAPLDAALSRQLDPRDADRKEDALTAAPDMEPMRTIEPLASRFIMSLAASRAQ